VHWLGKSAPNAAKEAKQLIHSFTPAETELQMENQDKANASLIARLRVGDEGQEGINAFLSKRPAKWIET
jgi:methylglutaconyl-CoA hydratase